MHPPKSSKSAAGLAIFRILFGALCLFAMLRGLSLGWINTFYNEPTFFFSYWGFSWLKPLGPDAMCFLYIAAAMLAAMISLGLFFKIATLSFFLIFSYIELCDVTNYLNHYYLVSLLAFLLFLSPAHAMWSLDAWRKKNIRSTHVPLVFYTILRLQLVIVYVFAAMAKCSSDWLLHARPMNIWLQARTEMPLLGAFFSESWVAFVFSWSGFLFDATIVLWLINKKTRKLAYLAVLGFHGLTALLFPIGAFPWLMIISTTLFFAPDWPLKFFANKRVFRFFKINNQDTSVERSKTRPSLKKPLFMCLVVVYFFFQIAIPLRHHFYSGNVLWTELGMRWSWRVMASEKNADTQYKVTFENSAHSISVSPNAYLTLRQAREMAGQPDLILQLGQHIGHELKKKYRQNVSVYAHSFASLNGRPATQLIDPSVNLMTLNNSLGSAPWVLRLPKETASQAFALGGVLK